MGGRRRGCRLQFHARRIGLHGDGILAELDATGERGRLGVPCPRHGGGRGILEVDRGAKVFAPICVGGPDVALFTDELLGHRQGD